MSLYHLNYNINEFSLLMYVQAFAVPDALGVIAVEGVPEVESRRALLLPLAAQLANLPHEALKKYTVPESNFSVGWSRGKEHLQAGRVDSLKGSFYANPLVDDPAVDVSADVRQQYHSVILSLTVGQHVPC
jgi:hypothetical protein